MGLTDRAHSFSLENPIGGTGLKVGYTYMGDDVPEFAAGAIGVRLIRPLYHPSMNPDKSIERGKYRKEDFITDRGLLIALYNTFDGSHRTSWKMCRGPDEQLGFDDYWMYRYQHFGEATLALMTWDGEGDPPDAMAR